MLPYDAVYPEEKMGIFKEMIGTGAFSAGMIVVMCAICVVVNLVLTALPAKYTSIDCSATKLYSLTGDTKDRVSKLDEDITIYVLNSKKSKDAKIDETINRYKDFSSHIKVKYVDPATSPKFYQDYTDTTPTTNSLIIESKNRSKVIDYNDIYEYAAHHIITDTSRSLASQAMMPRDRLQVP